MIKQSLSKKQLEKIISEQQELIQVLMSDKSKVESNENYAGFRNVTKADFLAMTQSQQILVLAKAVKALVKSELQ